jgi:FkbM family methyltransferase
MIDDENLHIGKLNQLLLNAIITTATTGLFNIARFRLLSAIRKVRLRFSDPLVRYRLEKTSLMLPLSHELPTYRRALPHYAMNLGRVLRRVLDKYPDLTMIDVGANVGDSAAIVRGQAQVPILCVEGEPRFFKLLKRNTEEMQEVERENAFLGEVGDRVAAVHVHRGNARIVLAGGNRGSAMRTLSEAIRAHPRFAQAKLLKLDAEGFDCRIISSESRLLAHNKPVLFFEYHPPLCATVGYDPYPIFELLRGIGYTTLIVYKNTGQYLVSLELSQRSELEEIQSHFAGIGGFCDVVAFHSEDADIAESIRNSECGRRIAPGK